MSEELVMTMEEAIPPENKMPGFKSVCLKLGLMMIIVFLTRAAASVVISLIQPMLEGFDETAAYLVDTLLSLLFLYAIPITAALIIFKAPCKGMFGKIYKKPVFMGNAMGMFPAIYGLGIMTNLLTMWISSFFAETDLYDSFNTVNELTSPNMACAFILMFQLVVIAPIFEELWFRGIVMESLRPYGNGFAILVSALLFGLTHGNLQQFFYATVLGVCLGYIAINTRSIIVTTVMHAMFNSIAGFIMLFISMDGVQKYMLSGGTEATDSPSVIAYMVFMFFVVILLLVGLIMAVVKLRKIRRYSVEKVWGEVSATRRWGIFFSRFTVIIMVILAADTLTFRFIPTFVYKMISGEL